MASTGKATVNGEVCFEDLAVDKNVIEAVLEEVDAGRLLGPGWQSVNVRKAVSGGYVLVGRMAGGQVSYVELDLPDILPKSPLQLCLLVERALQDALKALGSIGRPASLFVKA